MSVYRNAGILEYELQKPCSVALALAELPIARSLRRQICEVAAWTGAGEFHFSYVSRSIHLYFYTDLDFAVNGAKCLFRNIRQNLMNDAIPNVRRGRRACVARRDRNQRYTQIVVRRWFRLC